jgi:hypothetical protein
MHLYVFQSLTQLSKPFKMSSSTHTATEILNNEAPIKRSKIHPLQIVNAVNILVDHHNLTGIQHEALQCVTMKTMSGSSRKPNFARIPDKGSKSGCSHTWSTILGAFAARVMGCKVTRTRTRCLQQWIYVPTSSVSTFSSASSCSFSLSLSPSLHLPTSA